MVKMLRYVLLYLNLQKCLLFFLQFFCCFRVEIRNELANGCKLTNNQIRGWMLSEFRYLVAPPHYIGHTTGRNSQHTNFCMDIRTYKTKNQSNQEFLILEAFLLCPSRGEGVMHHPSGDHQSIAPRLKSSGKLSTSYLFIS